MPVAVTESWTAIIEGLKQKQMYGTVQWDKCYRVAKRQPIRPANSNGNSSYVSGVSVCIFVALYLCIFVALYLCMLGCLLQEPIRLKVL